MKYPEDLEINSNVVQQIQISHNFVESYITIEEKDWNSISYYNENKDIIIVLALDKFDDASDYTIILDEFKKELDLDIKKERLKRHLKEKYDLSLKVFRTRDEVIAKLSNEVAHLKTLEYDLKKRFDKIARSDHLKVKSKIQFLLAVNDLVSYDELKKVINTSSRWLNEVLKTLLKCNLIGYNNESDSYFLVF
jgi:predicted ABC-class ATPase